MSRLGLLLGALLAAATARAADPALPLGGDPRVDPTRFRVTQFASGLDFPVDMATLVDGSLLVGLNRSTSPSSSLLNSAGELVRLVDADDDGVADGPGSVLATGLDAITSVEVVEDLVFVATGAIGSPRIVLLRAAATPADPLTPLGSLDFSLPLPWSHITFGLTARERPGEPGVYEVYFNLGSRTDGDASVDPVPVTGLFSAMLQADSLYRVLVDDTGAAIAVTALERVAAGLRNAFGSAFDPLTGDLYMNDNGIGDPSNSVSVDELNRLAAAELGSPVEDFGFPGHYVAYGTGTVIGSGGILPLVAFQPLAGGAESRGPAGLAFAPPRFPAGLDTGVFVAFHGNFVEAAPANQTNPLVYVDLDTGHYFHFVAGGIAGVGHLDGLATSDDTLYVADLTAADGLETYGSGAIYAIRVKLPACDDGRDNDGDGATDLSDVGCRDAAWFSESPGCSDGLNNDHDPNGWIDFDGGLFALGYVAGAPDPQCTGLPWRNCEAPNCCGLGFELALILPGLMWLRRNARRR